MIEDNKANPIEESVLSILGLTQVSQTELTILTQKIITLVQRRVMNRLVDKMTSEDIDYFTEILELGRNDLLNEFVEEKVPHFYSVLGEEIEQVKEDMRDVIEEVQEKLNNGQGA